MEMLTNEQMELHQLWKQPSYDGDSISLPNFNSIGQSIFELESKNRNVDGQTNVVHINLIDGLVTCNPPKTKMEDFKKYSYFGNSLQTTTRNKYN